VNALSVMAVQNGLTLAWVPGHCVIRRNEEADTLARQASGPPLHGAEPALGITRCSVRGYQGLDKETTSLYLEKFDRSQTWKAVYKRTMWETS
jgi:hypothetical protein